MTPMRYKITLVALVLAAAGLAGCVSTKKRYERAVKAEEQGRYEEAAGQYIQVLQKEPGWEEARDGLRRTGVIVIENYLAEASRLDNQGQYVQSADMLDRVAAFHVRANAVGAGLTLPADFEAQREKMADRAIAKLLQDADRARVEGRWPQSLALYDQALARGRLSDRDVAEVRESRVVVMAGWSEQMFRDGSFRHSFEKAQEALDIVGMEHRLTDRLVELQRAALESGSVFVSMLPVAGKEEVLRRSGSLFLTDLNDILVYDHWSAPPPFILVADPVEVRRELRVMVGRSGRIVTKGEATAVGRAMDSDWVFTADLVRFERDERDVREQRVRARTRGRSPVDTSYVLRKMKVIYYSRADVRIYETRTGREMYSGHVEGGAEDRIERGHYSGDYRDLDLSGSELSYFDSQEIRSQEDRLEEAMADQLAAKIAERVYSRMIGWIP